MVCDSGFPEQTLGPASMTSASEPDFTSDDLNTGFPGRLSCSWHVCIDVVACDKDVGKFGYLPLEKKYIPSCR